jgi:hypothetical protein
MESMVLNYQTGFWRSLARAEISSSLLRLLFIFKQPKRPLYQHPLVSMALAFAFPLWTLINALSSSSKQSDILTVYQTQFFA